MEKEDNKTANQFGKAAGKPGGGWAPPRGNRSGRVLGGLFLIGIGVLLLASKLNALFLPSWVFSWQMFLIVLGLFLGLKHSFQRPGWLVLVLIGSVFLVSDYYHYNLRPYFWPILVISLGLWLLLRPRKPYRFRRHHYQEPYMPQQPGPGAPAGFEAGNVEAGTYTSPGTGFSTGTSADYAAHATAEDYVDSTAIFGGVKRKIISKNFKGGEVVSIFGGTELNLMQADIQHPVVLEATQVFGGTKLIVPPHWRVEAAEQVVILGGVQDERPELPQGYDSDKVLIIKGTSIFGGLNIKSF